MVMLDSARLARQHAAQQLSYSLKYCAMYCEGEQSVLDVIICMHRALPA